MNKIANLLSSADELKRILSEINNEIITEMKKQAEEDGVSQSETAYVKYLVSDTLIIDQLTINLICNRYVDVYNVWYNDKGKEDNK